MHPGRFEPLPGGVVTEAGGPVDLVLLGQRTGDRLAHLPGDAGDDDLGSP